MNRFERVRRVLMWDQVAAAAKAKADAERVELEEQARAEFVEHGTAPTWRIPDVGTVALPVSQEAVYVADEAALLEWVRRTFPSEVVAVEQVRQAFLGVLLGSLVTPAGDVAMLDTGEVVDGLGVRRGGTPLRLSFRPSRDAKAVAAAGAARLIEDVEKRIGGPVVIAEAGDGQA